MSDEGGKHPTLMEILSAMKKDDDNYEEICTIDGVDHPSAWHQAPTIVRNIVTGEFLFEVSSDTREATVWLDFLKLAAWFESPKGQAVIARARAEEPTP